MTRPLWFLRRGFMVLMAATLYAGSALACGCDEECPEGEFYSDDAEMCVSEAEAIS
ncbi:MAG: hypothetical protein AAGK00_11005 [Pseudomonadota bacterium]